MPLSFGFGKGSILPKGQGAPPWVPTNLSNLALWLDASDSSTLYQSSGGSLASADGDVVGEWRDKSGNSRHFTQSTATQKPLLKTGIINGKNVVRGDGVDDRLQQLGISPTYIVNSNFTLFVVLKQISGTGAYTNRSLGNSNGSTGTNGFNVLATGTTTGQNYFVVRNAAGNVGDISTTGTVSQGTAYQYSFKLSSGGASSWRNGSASGNTVGVTDVGTPPSPFTLFQDGTPSSNFFCNVDIAEFIIYSTALNDTDRQAVETYLISKWGIS